MIQITGGTSQHHIEKYINEYFDKPGFFLEIGCWDGRHISQTAALEEHGWKGVCVDPFPQNFSGRRAILCNKAISGDGKDREFVRVTIDRRHGGDVSYFSGFKDCINCHWPLISEHCDYEIVLVPTITINDLYIEYEIPAYVEFLSIDTEGAELEILKSMDFKTQTFGIVDFEHNENEVIQKEASQILKSHGYELIERLRVDDIYKHRILAKRS